MRKIFTVLGIVCASVAMNAQIVINEVYGGGGGTSAGIVLNQDYVELINKGTSSVTLTGAYLQYSSATSTSAVGASNIQALPNITLNPGQTFLIGEGTTTTSVGAALPTVDFAPTTNVLNMSATAGKIFLTSNNTPVASATDSNIIDFVGYGSTAVWFEGTAAAPAPSNTTSISRTNGVDTNNNGADFTAGTPTPQNSTSGTLAVSDFGKEKSLFVKNTFVKNNEIVFGANAKDVKVFNMFGQVIKTASVKADGTLNVSDLAKGNYIVTGTVNNEAVSQKILKD
ncbi:lamin tail domain-containing protein [Chryseobacterium taiwanense]|uniref:LTD domain-containing protein n=1 Tax=Chryseobacterium taiwanense TaxID=363331 RepID=A0A0B4D3H1_9FLAO|nr:lamin tail domain-containing protein [Chryseobacterium taiwanense]KIC63192.1 hypothetical protein RM51_09075 [Chryseobacterium taiwanense]